MKSFNTLLAKDLTARKNEGSFRSLKITDPDLIDFSSNDYLGLSRSAELLTEIEKAISLLPSKYNGATGSRLLTGNSILTQELESRLATLFKSEAVLLFNSGYTANLAVLSSLPKRGDTIIYDELSHASIKDGIRLSLASRQSFRHNDLSDLTKKLKRASGNTFVVVESVYSMDGDVAPLGMLTSLCEEYGAHLIVDEAHSTGIYGESGNGLSCQYGVEQKIPVRIYTFGKAMGIHGACVAGSKMLIDYLVNFARPFVYTTAMDQKSIVAIDCAVTFLGRNITLSADLQHKIDYFVSSMHGIPALLPSKTAIQSFIIPGNEKVKEVAHRLQRAGLDIRPILSPTVSIGKERLRIILHTFNSQKEIEKLTYELRGLSSGR